ncbi:hypothetical protein [Streptococcus pluranimalium]|uniref:Uncharacterized protein n=1 Tax=Streptococcus pluranimalium TaxID=82348 RepID=A0A345VMZ4_9STRE|nr:hypothetical protein [Streptococcus pluranimalium]AXJ14096.1 hypothetical protein Sp14A_22140 [Streptococcus pluranimalium]
MEIKRIYLDSNEVLGEQAFVSGFEEVPQTNYSPAYRVYQLDSRKERSAFVICESVRNAPKVSGAVEVDQFSGFSIARRTFTHDGKRYNENVFLVDGFTTK